MRRHAPWMLAVLVITGLFALSYVEMQEPARSLAPTLDLGRHWQADDVERIEIRHGTEAVVLKRHGHAWRMGGKPVDAQAVSRLLDDLKRMQVRRIVAWNRAHDRELGLDDADAREVRLFASDGTVLWHVRIGGQAQDLTSTYLRVQGDDRVLAVDKTLRWQVLRTPEAWLAREKTGGNQTAEAGERASSRD